MARPVAAGRRYAEAAFQVALAGDQLDRWKADLATAVQMLGRPDVAPTIENPAVPLAQRQEIVRQLLGPRISADALRLVALLVERGRANALPKVSEDYNRLLNAHRGVVEATVTSAVPLTADETAEIRTRVEAMAGSAVELRTEVNADLLGGLTVQIRDQLLDASIRGRLERLRDQLHAGGRLR
jgi:F-type H+-transporting ATPase subunit delta